MKVHPKGDEFTDKPQKTPIGYMFDCILHNINKDENGHVFITLKTHAPVTDDVGCLYNQPLECAIKKFSANKSLNANSYCWALCSSIAKATDLSPQDVYKQAIRNRGVFQDREIPADKLSDIASLWTEFGLGWFVEKVDFGAKQDTILVRCYYGTSSYNSSQLSAVLRYLTGEAENIGITTLSKQTQNNLIKEWEKLNS